MNILFLSTWFPYPPDNGSKIRAYYLLRALSLAHEVTVVAFYPDADQPQTDFGLEHVHVQPVSADPYRYVKAPQALKLASPVPVIYWPNGDMRRALNRVAAQPWDAIIAIQGPAARYAAQLKHGPKVCDIDTALSYQMRERHQSSTRQEGRFRTWLSWQKAQYYERRLFKRFQACTVVSAAELAYARSLVEGTACYVEVLSNGVDCQHNYPVRVAAVAPTLIYNGSLTYSANYDAMQYFLANIFPLIQQQIPDVSLTITGDTKGVNQAGLQLNDNVRLPGYVPDIRSLITSSAVCIAPLRQGSGTRLKILEAMALGTPVVSTTKGAEGLEIIDGEHLLLADDPAAFAQRTIDLLQDEARRRGLAANARRLVEQRYDWSQIGHRFVQLVEAAVRDASKI